MHRPRSTARPLRRGHSVDALGYDREWFAAASSDSSDWDVPRLLAAKGVQRVSVVLPARNEAGTIGGIVEAIRRDLVDRACLVDELVVIDSDSTDGTAEIASDAGARVYSAVDVRPELGPFPGKGEALWKSQ